MIFLFFLFQWNSFFTVVAVDWGGEAKPDSGEKNNFLKPTTLQNPLKPQQARNPPFAVVATETGVRLSSPKGQGAGFLWCPSKAALRRPPRDAENEEPPAPFHLLPSLHYRRECSPLVGPLPASPPSRWLPSQRKLGTQHPSFEGKIQEFV